MNDLDNQRLAQEKIDARERMLALPPEIAQQLVDQTLYPQFWHYNVEDLIWDESIPTCYDEIVEDLIWDESIPTCYDEIDS